MEAHGGAVAYGTKEAGAEYDPLDEGVADVGHLAPGDVVVVTRAAVDVGVEVGSAFIPGGVEGADG